MGTQHSQKWNQRRGTSRTGPLHALLATALLAIALPAAAEETAPAWVLEARQSAQALGGQLKAALTGAIQQDGAIAAIDVCQHEAPAIASRVSSDTKEVSRTALRVRNTDNAPDAWQQRVLEDFEHRLALGEDPASLEVFAVRHVDGERTGHWMKAIPTGGLCLTCHGSQLDPELQQAIDQRYPDDQATGFALDSLRGAFSVRIDLPERN